MATTLQSTTNVVKGVDAITNLTFTGLDNGVEYYILSMGVTADTHPFYTGKSTFVDTEGRIDKFQKRFGSSVRRAKKPSLG